MAHLKRRQFGKLAAASFTSTILVDFSSQVLAKTITPSQEITYGVKIGSASKARNKEDQAPALDLNIADMKTKKFLAKTNVADQSVDNPLPVAKKSRAFFLADSDRVTKVVMLGEGNLVISTVSHTRHGCFNHLISTVGGANNPRFKAKKILGLESATQTVESLLHLPNNQLLCLIGNEGIPPFSFKTIDLKTGKILSGDELNLPPLPPNHRFANLCLDSKGTIFATEIGSEGVPILIWMNLQDKAIITGKVKINRLTPLSFEGRPLLNDVKDLAFSPSGQLYALASINEGKNNALFTVDMKTGKMLLAGDFEGEKFTFFS
ncbi:hypothetical protein [Anabaena sp. UHCC 0399]|uniref:hypothetical protein n=1 Tax=Anabaena sp. UHCC 0399 TaxID=3110238 RepID=UPI002B2048DA|nr:hypothetical protein [Anabaena sp. UHCC 0399]MEA5566114.1 hypothetical protein [Anabaena sp. UHCC 0399]